MKTISPHQPPPAANAGRPLITLDDITVRLCDRFLLPGTSWEITTGQSWAILGANGAGKSSLAGVLTGDVPHVRGSVVYHFPQRPRDVIGCVSSELQERLIALEMHQDMARSFAHRAGDIRKAGAVILEGSPEDGNGHPDLERVAGMLGIGHLLDRGIRHLSSGEMRRVLIARALIKSPRLLILDEPFAGIDGMSREKLMDSISGLMSTGLQVVQVTHRVQEILPSVSHVLFVKNGRVLMQGRRGEVLTEENMGRLYGAAKPNRNAPRGKAGRSGPEEKTDRRDVLVDMKNVTVEYGGVTVLSGLNWRVRRGENWAVVGPSGSGKTTLLSMITGDNQQAYANEISLFGVRRGSGESIWEIKSRLGTVSAEFQTAYRNEISVYDAVASGLFDSVGLYRNPDAPQREQVERWLELFGISGLAGRMFNRLSFGERRTVLLARAMVKSPELLVLDEPCLGLDRENRRLFMNLMELIGERTDTTLLYVTHHRDEIPACTDFVLSLQKAGGAAPRFSVHAAADFHHRSRDMR